MVSAVQFYPGLFQWAMQAKKSSTNFDSGGFETQRVLPDIDSGNLSPLLSDQAKLDAASTGNSASDPLQSVVTGSAIFSPSPNSDASQSADEPFVTPPDRFRGFTTDFPAKEDRSTSFQAEAGAAIQIVNGKPYPNLEAACAEASDVDSISIIELRYNGVRESERPIRLTNKKIVIRAGEGYRTVLIFRGVSSSSWWAPELRAHT